MCVATAGKVMNPVGAIAPNSGPLRLIDPAKDIARRVGGEKAPLIDPTGYFRGEYDPDLSTPPPEKPKAANAPRHSTQTSTGRTSSGTGLKIQGVR